jgi:methylase of polypeptide subunit release factors
MSEQTGKHQLFEVEAARYLSAEKVLRIKDRLSVKVTEHCFLPHVDDLQSDWVSYILSPALKLLRKRNGGDFESFCSIGTGSGLDVLTGIEILGAKRAGLTDVHEDVVLTAAENVRSNLKNPGSVTIEAGYGDLLEPLRKFKPRYDVIYENLPNVPAIDTAGATEDRKSSTHVPPRKESIPASIKKQMLDLHYLAFVQAKDFLSENGSIISTLGGRVPLEVFIELGRSAGFASSVLTYSWKVQAVAEDVIRDHAKLQKEGFGPFFFYHADTLEKHFAGVDIESSGERAFDIEKSLIPHRLDAATAYEEFSKGKRIGHTAVVLKSERLK